MRLENKQILVTGGAGFVGTHVVDELKSMGCDEVIVPRSKEYDLRDTKDVKRLYTISNPDVVIHLAGTVGGIGIMDDKPGDIFYDNATMSIELIEEARQHYVDKFVSIGSVSAYPKNTQIPFREKNLWDGYPEETRAPYGIAKKLPLVQSQAYKKQEDFDCVYLLPTNLYGPYDDFDLASAHVIPAIIRKVDNAIRSDSESITAWGTGNPTREFLYIEDAAEAIVEATAQLNEPEPINIGTGNEISIRNLVNMIVTEMGFEGTVEWDKSKPDGQPRRCLDTSRAEEKMGWTASTDFENGLKKSIDWFQANRTQIIE